MFKLDYILNDKIGTFYFDKDTIDEVFDVLYDVVKVPIIGEFIKITEIDYEKCDIGFQKIRMHRLYIDHTTEDTLDFIKLRLNENKFHLRN
jgi:hypothetical protein